MQYIYIYIYIHIHPYTYTHTNHCIFSVVAFTTSTFNYFYHAPEARVHRAGAERGEAGGAPRLPRERGPAGRGHEAGAFWGRVLNIYYVAI